MASLINTSSFSKAMRKRGIIRTEKKVLITNFSGSTQEKDLTLPPNCGGFGRIRHFTRDASRNWPGNPLPIDPACKALDLERKDLLQAQIYQNAICNWRCWYCFVDFKLLSANRRYSEFYSADELLELYCAEESPPRIIDLSGGQPDLVPEWIPWMMAALRDRSLDKSTYLWSDDNLSTDYFFRYLRPAEQKIVREYSNYGKVCCFKGFDEKSFSFNTKASPTLFKSQFELFSRYLELGIDLYAYVTLTSSDLTDIRGRIVRFLDLLQEVHRNLPLRTVPLEIGTFGPVLNEHRLARDVRLLANKAQQQAICMWREEIPRRFPQEEIGRSITDIPLH